MSLLFPPALSPDLLFPKPIPAPAPIKDFKNSDMKNLIACLNDVYSEAFELRLALASKASPESGEKIADALIGVSITKTELFERLEETFNIRITED